DRLDALGYSRCVDEFSTRKAEQFPRPAQSFFDRILSGQEGVGDFGDAETAKGFKDESNLGFGGKLRMAAGKHHAELVVLNLPRKGWRFRSDFLPKLHEMDEFRSDIAELVVPAQEINGAVAGHAHKPGGGIFGQAVNRPRLQRPAKGVLDHVLGQVEAAQPENPG